MLYFSSTGKLNDGLDSGCDSEATLGTSRVGQPAGAGAVSGASAIVLELTESAIVRAKGISHAGRGLQWYHGRGLLVAWGL